MTWNVAAGPISTVIRGATLLPLVESARALSGDLVISGSRITHVGPNAAIPPGADVLERRGHYVMPGLIQTHLHLVQTIFRGLAEDLTLLDWLRRRIWPLEAAHDADSVRASVRLGLVEVLGTGTTTIGITNTTGASACHFRTVTGKSSSNCPTAAGLS